MYNNIFSVIEFFFYKLQSNKSNYLIHIIMDIIQYTISKRVSYENFSSSAYRLTRTGIW